MFVAQVSVATGGTSIKLSAESFRLKFHVRVASPNRLKAELQTSKNPRHAFLRFG
jgi:hypothetical protein